MTATRTCLTSRRSRRWSRPSARHVCVGQVPSGDPTRDTVARLAELLEADDLVIDGGNSRFSDDFENAKLLGDKGIGYVDCGVSGGVWGLENGYGLMCGGDETWVERAMPIFDALRPEGPRAESFVHAGDVGAGHYAKMVHNGIEYGLMHAYAGGYELLEAKDIVKDVPGTFRAWSRGTVVRSWLLDLMVDALEEDPHLGNVSDYTHDSGEGRWTVEEAIALGVPMPVISASLFARFASRQKASPAMLAGRRAAWPVRGAPRHDDRRRGTALREGECPWSRPSGDKVAHDVRSFEAKGDASSRAFGRASRANVEAAQEAVDAGAPPARSRRTGLDTALGTERSKRADWSRRARPTPDPEGLPQLSQRRCRTVSRVTTLIGLNGQGKTNLVEAIGYLATLGSHRVATDQPLVRFGASQGIIRGAIVRDGRETMVELEITPVDRNRARLGRAPVARPRDVLGTVRTVLFAPRTWPWSGDPSERRRFLDDLLVQRQPRWAGVRSDYDKILRQRNALLKSAAPVLRRSGRGASSAPGRATARGGA